MPKDHLTSAEAARLLGVSPSSIKRWADTGVLECLKTSGQHRRFERVVVERFRRRVATHGGEDATPAPPDDSWFDLLEAQPSPLALDARLLDARAALGGWWLVADALSPLLDEIGERWRVGRIDILAEHELSECLARALGRVAASIPVALQAPLALLTVAEDEEHTLGLSLLEVCLREAGFRVKWAGRRTPLAEVLAAVDSNRVDLVAVSASEAYESAARLAEQAMVLSRACAASGVDLLLGGRGPWPSGLDNAPRIRTFSELHRFVESQRGRITPGPIQDHRGAK